VDNSLLSYVFSLSLMKAFPKGSSLAIDISRATLKAIESGEVQKLEEKMLSTTNCGSTNNNIQNEQLGPQPFFGLFGICGTIAVIGLLATIVHFVKRKAQTFMNYILLSQLQRGVQIIKLFGQKHPYKYRRSAPSQDANSRDNELATPSIKLTINCHTTHQL